MLIIDKKIRFLGKETKHIRVLRGRKGELEKHRE